MATKKQDNKPKDPAQDELQAAARHRLIGLMQTYDKPLTKYPLADQAQEIDKRLADVADHCAEIGAVMTKAHIQLILGIDDNTMTRWAKMASRCKEIESKPEDERQYMQVRGATLKKWLLYAESAGTELAATKQVAAGSIFLLKSVFKYREIDKEEQAKAHIGIEFFLKEAGKKEKQIITDVVDALPAPD